MKKKTTMTVTDIRRLAEAVFSMKLRYPEGDLPEEVKPGQFAGLYPNDPSKLLPRPISICRWDPDTGELQFVFRVAGAGTASLAAQRPGDSVDMLGALAGRPGTVVTAVMGYRNSDLFLTEELKEYSKLLIATEDGSVGTKGNVLDAVRETSVRADVVCACGPMPMLRAVKKFAREQGIPAYISLEERMACGVGACLGCVTKTVKTDSHSHVRNARICTEGPVFDAEEVEI